MKKIVSVLILILILTLSLTACGEKSEVTPPDGMQLATATEGLGYYLFVPEEWTLSSRKDTSAAYASNVDSTNVSFVETALPALLGDDSMIISERLRLTFNAEFNKSLEYLKTSPKLIIDGEAMTFGNADYATKYVFDSVYKEHKFRTMQALVYFKEGNRYGIFTFTSPYEPMSSDVPQYEYYTEKLQKIVDSFKFVEKKGYAAPEDNRPADADGYLLSTNKNTLKIGVYLPSEMSIVYNDGMCCAKFDDNTSLTVSQISLTSTSVSAHDYWLYRKAELEKLFGEVNEISIDMSRTIGDKKNAFAYEYTYSYMGEVYHIYQVYTATRTKAFAITYTAKEANYSAHLSELENILMKVDF